MVALAGAGTDAMIYLECIQRDRFMPLEIFRALGDQATWTDPTDRLVLNLARTLRLGPHPAYLAFWKCDTMRRLDEWEDYFNSDAGLRDVPELASLRSIHISDAGCYDEVIEGPQAEGGLQYVEFLDLPAPAERAEVAEHFVRRAQRYADARLNLVVRRVGRLGPAALGDMAVWTFPSYVALEAIVRDAPPQGPFRPFTAGVYRAFGRETL
jgi:hypothetical protein